MFSDYKNLILEDYRKKKEQNMLPLNLVIPSSANLKEECLKVCEERFHSRDLKTLRDFFGVFDGKEGCLRAIRRMQTDKFKPVGKFIKGETKDPNERIIELLAWLIDFQPRPYEFRRKYERMAEGRMEEGTKEAGEGKQETGGKEKGGMEDRPLEDAAAELQLASTAHLEPISLVPRKKAGLLKWLIPGAIAVVAVTGFSIMKFRDKPPTEPTKTELLINCMYWTGEQYKVVPCNTHPGSIIVIALDTFQLNNFKRVMQIDTITLKSTGKLWYLKRNKSLEIFTAPGNHPEELHKKLKPLSAYMIKKYILKNDR